MNSTLRLQARGYQVVFEVKQTQPVEGFLDIRIAFTLDPRLGGITVEAVPISVMLADLSRLITYFEDHITRLEQDPDSESFTFVPLDLQFQLQAFSGEVRAPNDGEFTMQFMVNVGLTEEGTRVYVGGESLIYLEELNQFLSSLRQLLAELAQP